MSVVAIRRLDFPAQPQVQRQLRAQFEIVLQVSGIVVPDGAQFGVEERRVRAVHLAEQKTCDGVSGRTPARQSRLQVAEREQSRSRALRVVRVHVALIFESHFEGVLSPDQHQ